MYLRRLELQGYKTFATRTEFEFLEGITAIVGPNGSGKSNIADAVRWVMGEHRYSSLRARRSDDMIFAGGDGRPRVGMAEVSLTLDNSTGWLPVDYSEVTVQRRTFRSGENQYLLNGSRVRRRDVLELLAEGGVSSNTYTIIGQGAVDASLSMRPEERRLIFEEAAGIAIHQAKRDQALSRLEDTRQNLLRVNDIISEIKPQLQRLAKQAERAREYQEASGKLEELLSTWYGYRWHRAQEELELAQQRERSLRDDVLARKGQLEAISERIDALRRRRAELRGELGDWHTQSGELHVRLEALQKELAVKQERHRLLGQRRHELEQEIPPLTAGREARVRRITELESELERLTKERGQQDAERLEYETALEELEGRRHQLEAELSHSQELAFDAVTGLSDARNRLQQIRQRKRDLNAEREEHGQVVLDLEKRRRVLAQEAVDLKSERQGVYARLERLTFLQREKKEARDLSAAKQRDLASRLAELDRDLARMEARREVLSKAQAELADYGEAVRKVLEHRNRLPGVRTTLVELLEVPAELEPAISAVLGTLLQALVTDGWADARRSLEFLAASNSGRATFLPLDSLPQGQPREEAKADGVLGLACALVRVRKGYEPLLDSLLGSTVVVEDLDAARRVHDSHPRLRVVTLQGHLIGTDGSLTGGSSSPGSLLLAHERERRELPQEIELLDGQKRAVEESIAGEEARDEDLMAALKALEAERAELDAALRAAEEEIASRQASEQRVAGELAWHKEAAARLAEEVSTLQEEEKALLQEAETREEREREIGRNVAELQKELACTDGGSIREQLASLRTSVAVLERTQESQQTALSGHCASLEQIEAQLEEKRTRIQQLSAEEGDLETSIGRLREQVDTLSGEVDRVSSEIQSAEQEAAQLEKEQSELEQSEASSQRKLQDLEAAFNKAVLKRQRAEDELRNLKERIEADLETVSLRTELPTQLPLDVDARIRSLAPVAEVPQDLEAEIDRLRRRLRQVGPVDLESVDEYDHLAERHSFLVSQVEDLQQAAASLRKVVSELDKTMRGIFLDAFGKIAAEFESYFTRLFNGGSAQLLLNDPENPLMSGVEIVAQPPGRRRRSVDMLSGGERALTGVALTFAILKACGTPFCFLDEVDARLDEVNVGRFGEALAELAQHTQLVVITHNRLTLEKADSIYGITMGGDGASRVLSLRLEDAKARVAQA